jgi:hypothetical protein
MTYHLLNFSFLSFIIYHLYICVNHTFLESSTPHEILEILEVTIIVTKIRKFWDRTHELVTHELLSKIHRQSLVIYKRPL